MADSDVAISHFRVNQVYELFQELSVRSSSCTHS